MTRLSRPLSSPPDRSPRQARDPQASDLLPRQAGGAHPSVRAAAPCGSSTFRYAATAFLLLGLSRLPAQQHAVSRSPVPASPTMSAADLETLHTALDAYDRGDAERAESPLLHLTTIYPGSYPAAEALGSLYVEASRLPEALPLLERAARLAPRDPLAHTNLGAAFAALKQSHDAVRELHRAADLTPPGDPNYAAAQSSLAHALLFDQQPAAAAQAFAAAAAPPTTPDPDLLYNWSLALLRAGSPAKAAEVLDRIPAADRKEETLTLSADISERLGHFQLALASLQTAARQNPSDANLYALTLELLRHWTWDTAIEVARFGAQRYPASPHFRIAEGIAHYAASDYKSAIPLFADLLTEQPENDTVADLLGRSCSLVAEGEELGCRGVYAYAMAHPGNAVMTTYAAAAILHQPQAAQNLPEAQKLLSSALAANPRYAPAWFQLGVLHGIQLDWPQSAADLEHAVTLEPTLPEAHYRLSRAYAHLGRPDAAQAQLALQQTYAAKAKTTLDTRLQEVVTFLVQPAQPQPTASTTTQSTTAPGPHE